MKMTIFRVVLAIFLAFDFYAGGRQLGRADGRVQGCQYAYRDLYTKYGIKHIDEDSLKSFCEKQ